MELITYFEDFLGNIRLTTAQIDDLKQGHKTLRKRLEADETIASLFVTAFLQGSYRRGTAIRPHAGKRADVDVVVVTKLSRFACTPKDAQEKFFAFMDKYYSGKYTPQGRSIAIELGYVDLDLVITSAPSEVDLSALKSESVVTENTAEEADDWRLVKSWLPLEKRGSPNAKAFLEAARKEAEWQLSPLWIPDCEVQVWEQTHPLKQIQWTVEKNRLCNGHYVNVVKALKWWRRVNYEKPKYPKSYPFEHLIGQSCPDGITSVAQGVTLTLEQIASRYATTVSLGTKPVLPDHGVPSHDVFHRVAVEDFALFYAQVCDAAAIARRALDATTLYDSAKEWQKLFGDKFPEPPSSKSGGVATGGYTPRTENSQIGGGRYG